MPEQRICAECAAPFMVPPSSTTRRCSSACVAKFRPGRPRTRPGPKPTPGLERPCAHCGVVFRPRTDSLARGYGRYCSHRCSGLGRRTRETLGCATCGAVLSLIPSRSANGKGRYCSNACFSLGRTRAYPARLYAKIDTSGDGCHPWLAARDKDGYGRVRRGMERLRAHRAVWEHHHGPIPPGMQVCHRCDNPPCCRVEHLFLETGLGNTRDRQAKGRPTVPRGVLNPIAKLTAQRVREMRALYAGGTSIAALARSFAMSENATNAVVHCRTWKHVV